MKRMLHYLITGAVPMLSFSSCYIYQLNTVSSTNLVHNPAKGSFVQENDSLRITYTLGALHAPPVTIEIFNKLDEPLLVDWQRSALVYNDSSISYAPNKANFVAASRGVSIDVTRDISVQRSVTGGQVTLPTHVEFIPPHSYIRNTPIQLPNDLLHTVPDSAMHPFLLGLRDNPQPAKAQKAIFTPENSPLTFSSFLTLYNSNKEHPGTITYLHKFYISELVLTKASPENTFYINERPGIRYYLIGNAESGGQRPSAKSTVIGVAGSNVKYGQ